MPTAAPPGTTRSTARAPPKRRGSVYPAAQPIVTWLPTVPHIGCANVPQICGPRHAHVGVCAHDAGMGVHVGGTEPPAPPAYTHTCPLGHPTVVQSAGRPHASVAQLVASPRLLASLAASSAKPVSSLASALASGTEALSWGARITRASGAASGRAGWSPASGDAFVPSDRSGDASGRPALSAVCPPQAVVTASTASHANARLPELEGEGRRLMTRDTAPGSFAPDEPANNPASAP